MLIIIVLMMMVTVIVIKIKKRVKTVIFELIDINNNDTMTIISIITYIARENHSILATLSQHIGDTITDNQPCGEPLLLLLRLPLPCVTNDNNIL